MNRIYLIACSSRKVAVPCKARDLYCSPLFRMSLAYAEKQRPEAIYILSAKHGLVDLEQPLSPYDKKLTAKTAPGWRKKVLEQLKPLGLENTFVFLTGKQYFLPLPHTETPLKGLSLGKRLQFLKAQL